MAESIREPAAAGTFYEETKKALRQQIEDCYTHSLGPGKVPGLASKGEGRILGLVSPHAGYVYSGPVAARGFYETVTKEVPEVVVILGPNHRGFGASVAMEEKDIWKTPLGETRIDKELAEKIPDFESGGVERRKKLDMRSFGGSTPFLNRNY